MQYLLWLRWFLLLLKWHLWLNGPCYVLRRGGPVKNALLKSDGADPFSFYSTPLPLQLSPPPSRSMSTMASTATLARWQNIQVVILRKIRRGKNTRDSVLNWWAPPQPLKITPFLGVESENGADAHKNNTFALLKTKESGDPRYSHRIFIEYLNI